MGAPKPADDKENCNNTGLKTDNGVITERVREDVYLVDKSNTFHDKNLLANSIAVKLKQGSPADLAVRTKIMSKLRRENLRDHLNLSNLNKQYSLEMQQESNRLDNEGMKLLRRQDQMRKQSEWQRKNQDKIRSQIRRTSVKIENGQGQGQGQSNPLPHIKQSSIQSTTITRPGGETNIGHSVVYHHAPDMILKERSKTFAYDFPKVPVDKDDPTYVKMFKNNGIFQPQNKYPNKSRAGSGILKSSSSLPEYQILTLSLNDSASDISSTSEKSLKRKKGLRVTWSGVDREHKISSRHDEESSSPTDSHKSTDGASSPANSSVKSLSLHNDTYIFQKVSPRMGRSKIESIGIQWKLPVSQKKERNERSRSAHAGKLSHNLIPCATGMNKEGTSVAKTKWFVPDAPSITTYEMYKAWLEKLEKLKYPAETRKVQISPSLYSPTQSLVYPIPGNVTMATEPLDVVL